MASSTGGSTANVTGNLLEEWVKRYIESEGYEEHKSKDFLNELPNLAGKTYARQVLIGKNIYGRDRKVDFVLHHPELWRDGLVIECKWQGSAGSVEEKYPFLVYNIALSGRATIIVLDGEGYREDAKNWLHNQVGSSYLRQVFTLGEFQRFAARGGI